MTVLTTDSIQDSTSTHNTAEAQASPIRVPGPRWLARHCSHSLCQPALRLPLLRPRP